jgi:hypothetical protein
MPRDSQEVAVEPDATARIVRVVDDKRSPDGLAKCGRCGAPLLRVGLTEISPRGYTFDGQVWHETADRRARRERDRRAVANGRGSAADRRRLRHNDYGRRVNDPFREYRSGGLVLDDPRIADEFEERFHLPQLVACGPCGAVNHIPVPGPRDTWFDRWICRHNREVAEDTGITC